MSKAKKKKKAEQERKQEQALRAKIKAEKLALKKAKRKKIFATIIVSVAVLLTVSIVLSVTLRPVPAIKMFKGTDYEPSSVFIIDSGSFGSVRPTGTIELSAKYDILKDEYNSFMDAYKKAVSFTFASGILHQSWFPTLKITLDDDDNPTITKSMIDSLAGSAEQPLVVARYTTPVTQKIKGIEITYDRVYFHFIDSQSNITEFKMYLVNSDLMENADPRIAQEYRAYQFSAKGILSNMWTVYSNILENN